jgi:hypothetical protein
MEPEGSLPHSHVPATCPYPVPFYEKITLHRIWKKRGVSTYINLTQDMVQSGKIANPVLDCRV